MSQGRWRRPLAPWRQTGLSILPRRGWRSLALAGLLGMGFGLYMALADRLVFAGAVPPMQHMMVRDWPLGTRWSYFFTGAFLDEVKLRLAAMTLLAWVASRWRQPVPDGAMRAIIVAVALVAYPVSALDYFTALPWSALTLARELCLHGTAGMLWGWLYWRNGWSAAVVGHLAAHVTLQPLLALP